MFIGTELAVEILIVKTAGFCFGVKRAIDTTFAKAEKQREGVFTFGPLIHNPQVIEKLRAKGVAPTEDICCDDIKALIIRTHGISLHLMEKATQRGYEVIDATCPFVKKAQHFAKLLKEEGYQVVILGDREHPEVRGLMGYGGNDVLVTDGREQLPALRNRVGIVVQTTQPVEALKKLCNRIIEQSKEIKVYNTICNSTALRLMETEEMAKKVGVMIVVGGRNSANTTQLARLCASLPVRTYHIETAVELEREWFAGVERVGITAGASTPEWIIRDVQERIKDIGGREANGI
ncbi:MAG: 4-hydroxy-3-methylbut-2-enyl diphosphate reductase [Thermodesulfovibrionales bacterium]